MLDLPEGAANPQLLPRRNDSLGAALTIQESDAISGRTEGEFPGINLKREMFGRNFGIIAGQVADAGTTDPRRSFGDGDAFAEVRAVHADQ